MVLYGLPVQDSGVLSPFIATYDECVIGPHGLTKAGRTYALADWDRLHDQLEIYIRRNQK